jgi:hypothetical protein
MNSRDAAAPVGDEYRSVPAGHDAFRPIEIWPNGRVSVRLMRIGLIEISDHPAGFVTCEDPVGQGPALCRAMARTAHAFAVKPSPLVDRPVPHLGLGSMALLSLPRVRLL